jgi:hypothetical protein
MDKKDYHNMILSLSDYMRYKDESPVCAKDLIELDRYIALLEDNLTISIDALKRYANQDNWRPLMGQELGEHKLFIYSGCTPNILYAGYDAFNALEKMNDNENLQTSS